MKNIKKLLIKLGNYGTKFSIKYISKDKTKQAFNGVRAGLSNLRSAVFSVQSAIIGIGGGLAVKSILNVGSQVEQLRLDLLLFKGVQGDKAFKGLLTLHQEFISLKKYKLVLVI